VKSQDVEPENQLTAYMPCVQPGEGGVHIEVGYTHEREEEAAGAAGDNTGGAAGEVTLLNNHIHHNGGLGITIQKPTAAYELHKQAGSDLGEGLFFLHLNGNRCEDNSHGGQGICHQDWDGHATGWHECAGALD
jgi:hypothetical protein